MSVFDDLDDVPVDITDGTYLCTLVKASIQDSKKDDRKWFIINWLVDDDDPNYPGEDITEMFRVVPGMSAEEFRDLPAEERKSINMARRFRENRLRSLGVPEAKLNDVDLSALEDIRAYLTITIKTGKDGVRKFTQVDELRLADKVEETAFSLTS